MIFFPVSSATKSPEEETVIASLTIEDDTQRLLFEAVCKLLITVNDIQVMQNATAKDLALKKVMKYVCIGWPRSS